MLFNSETGSVFPDTGWGCGHSVFVKDSEGELSFSFSKKMSSCVKGKTLGVSDSDVFSSLDEEHCTSEVFVNKGVGSVCFSPLDIRVSGISEPETGCSELGDFRVQSTADGTECSWRVSEVNVGSAEGDSVIAHSEDISFTKCNRGLTVSSKGSHFSGISPIFRLLPQSFTRSTEGRSKVLYVSLGIVVESLTGSSSPVGSFCWLCTTIG